MRFLALRSPSFRMYEGGALFSVNGQWINRVVIGWVGWEMTGSATWVGLLSFCLFAPTVLTSPLFGVLMDRIQLRPAALVSHGIVTMAVLVLYFLYAGDLLTIGSLSAVALVIGIAGSAERSVRMTIVPRMVDLDALPNAVAIHAANFNVARLVGPAIGGIMIEMLGTGTTMFINVLVFLPNLVAIFFLTVRERDSSKGEVKNFMAELWAGARHAALHPIIREAMLLTALSSLTVRGVAEIVPVIADGLFNRGAEGLGQMLSAGGGGALIAALTISLRSASSWAEGIPLIAHAAIFLGLLAVSALGLIDNWYLAVACVGVTGFCGTMVGINMQSAIQLQVDDAFRGRVMSLWMVVGLGTSALGALLLGSLTDLFGLSETLTSVGLIGIAAVVFLRYVLAHMVRSK
jgi:MFS family permease